MNRIWKAVLTAIATLVVAGTVVGFVAAQTDGDVSMPGKERLNNFQEQLRAFRDRERAMNEALLAAQQLRVDVEEQATRQAETIVSEAKAESVRLVEEATRAENLVHDRMAEAQRQFASYVTNLRALLERQMGQVEGLEAHISATPLPEAEVPLKRQA